MLAGSVGALAFVGFVLVVLSVKGGATHSHGRGYGSTAASQTAKPGESDALVNSESSAGSSATVEVSAAESALEKIETQSAGPFEQSVQRLKYLDFCSKNESCDFSHETAQSYQLEVQAELEFQLRDLKEFIQLKMNQGQSVSEEAQTLARYFVFSGGDRVKLAAIEILNLAPISRENLMSMLAGVERSSSPLVMRAGLKESERYLDAPERAAIETFQINAITRGTHAIQLEAARNGEFMCGDRAGDFAAIEREAEPRSQVRQFLQLNREECRHRLQGG